MNARQQRTLRPNKKNHKLGSKREKLHKLSRITLASSSLHDAVKVPEGEDVNDWIAMTCTDFFNDISELVTHTVDFCTVESCPVMAAGAFEYLWSDGTSKPEKLSAPDYIDNLMVWIEAVLSDEAIFPLEDEFPPSFIPTVKVIMKKLFRVLAHLFCNHENDMQEDFASAKMVFKHVVLFSREFNLIDDREFRPMETAVNQLLYGGAPPPRR